VEVGGSGWKGSTALSFVIMVFPGIYTALRWRFRTCIAPCICRGVALDVAAEHDGEWHEKEW